MEVTTSAPAHGPRMQASSVPPAKCPLVPILTGKLNHLSREHEAPMVPSSGSRLVSVTCCALRETIATVGTAMPSTSTTPAWKENYPECPWELQHSLIPIQVTFTDGYVHAEEMIVGMGADLVEIGRIRRSIELYGDRFLNRIYTPLEQAYCSNRGVSAAESFAARFAAKEAAMKALATGMWRGVNWKDFEVANEASGRPVLRFHGQAKLHADRLRAKRSWLSLSHAIDHAMAVVVLED